jgi:hypothetical protein
LSSKDINPRQLEVLRWIADGCPDLVMTGFTYKTTAAALRNRRLVKVSKRGGWHAEITQAGLHYLEHGPDVAEAKPRRGPKRLVERDLTESKDQAAGSTQAAAEPTADMRRAPEPLPPVAVPAILRKPHPVVAELRDEKDHFAITGPSRNRALRIVQGLILAVERASTTYGAQTATMRCTARRRSPGTQAREPYLRQDPQVRTMRCSPGVEVSGRMSFRAGCCNLSRSAARARRMDRARELASCKTAVGVSADEVR